MTAATDYETYRRAFRGREFPLAYLDLDALDRNVAAVRERAGDLPVRVASKSLRCRGALQYVLEADGIEGVMCFTGHEAAFLAEHGFEDLLVAYPVVAEPELEAVCGVASETRVTLMVDSREHVDRAAEAARWSDVELSLCLDLDVSTSHYGIHFGVRRSPVSTPREAVDLAEYVRDRSGVTLRGVMGYEGQIAGLPDHDPSNNAVVDAVVRRLKARSRPIVRERRTDVVEALRDAGFDCPLVNGGGTGSLESTREDPSVTEVTVGSGFYAPALFDGYDAFQHAPAAGYAVEVVRRPSAGVYTCRGGGYPASGPPGADKAPVVHLPEGASLTDAEGAGEVQTPVEYGGDLSVGDPVLLRHAKAGELCERFERLHLLRDGEVVGRTPTYRGDGRRFL